MNLALYKQKESEEKTRFGDVTAACARYSLGRATLMREAGEADAVLRIGKRILINYNALDRYFDSLSGR